MSKPRDGRGFNCMAGCLIALPILIALSVGLLADYIGSVAASGFVEPLIYKGHCKTTTGEYEIVEPVTQVGLLVKVDGAPREFTPHAVLDCRPEQVKEFKNEVDAAKDAGSLVPYLNCDGTRLVIRGVVFGIDNGN